MSATPPARRPIRPDTRVWAVLRVLAPVIVMAGVLGVIVGAATGQDLGIILVDLMVVAVGTVLLLTVRWKR